MTTTTWNIDSSHSGVHFSVRHMVVSKVRGRFAKYTGTVHLDDDLGKSRVEVAIDTASIDTGTADRDAHLRSADFFDAEKFPSITFRSTRVEHVDGEKFRLFGNLTIRDVTREVVLEATHGGRSKDPWGNERAGFEAKTAIDRKDFGLTWNQVLEVGGVLVGDRVDLEIEVEAVRAAAAQVA